MNKITEWTNSVDDRTWGIIRTADLSDGLWYEGYFESWPQAYQLFNGNPSGTYVDTKKNIITCLEHAKQQADDEPAGLAGGTGINEVVGEGSQLATSAHRNRARETEHREQLTHAGELRETE